VHFSAPYSIDARVIQHTIQLIPRLPDPTLVTAVLIQPDMPIKKGQALFQFDRRPYEYQVHQLEAQLASAEGGIAAAKSRITQYQAGLIAAKQDVLIQKTDEDASVAKVDKLKSQAEYAKFQYQLYAGLAAQGAGPLEESQSGFLK
jgi:multidrug resistance efflux pump